MQKALFDEEPQPVQPEPAPPAPFTWSEQWRHECEVRHVLNLSPMERRGYLERVTLKRGAERGGQLRRDVEAQL
jgi:hypothetical protein